MKVKTQNSSGFTLVELLVAVTILVMISGVSYSAFRSALRLYKREDQKLTMVQKARFALERMLLDLNNAYISPNDQLLSFVSVDSSDQNLDTDTLTFATISDPTLQSQSLRQQLEANIGNDSDSSTAQIQPAPDLIRVAYYIGIDPNTTTSTTLAQGETDQPKLSLIRAASANLNLDEVADFLFGSQSSNLNASMQDQLSEQVRIGVVIDDILSLNFRYFDGENWLDSWDDQEQLPQAVEVSLTLTDEDGGGKIYTQASTAHLALGRNP